MKRFYQSKNFFYKSYYYKFPSSFRISRRSKINVPKNKIHAENAHRKEFLIFWKITRAHSTFFPSIKIRQYPWYFNSA